MFILQAKKRLKAAEEKNKNVRELADSTLQQISEDVSDTRQHLAKRELERREKLNKKDEDNDEKELKKTQRRSKPGLLTKTKEGTKQYLNEHSTDMVNVSREYIKYMM